MYVTNNGDVLFLWDSEKMMLCRVNLLTTVARHPHETNCDDQIAPGGISKRGDLLGSNN